MNIGKEATLSKEEEAILKNEKASPLKRSLSPELTHSPPNEKEEDLD